MGGAALPMSKASGHGDSRPYPTLGILYADYKTQTQDLVRFVSRAKVLEMGPRLTLTHLDRDIGAVETLEHRLLVALVPG